MSSVSNSDLAVETKEIEVLHQIAEELKQLTFNLIGNMDTFAKPMLSFHISENQNGTIIKHLEQKWMDKNEGNLCERYQEYLNAWTEYFSSHFSTVYASNDLKYMQQSFEAFCLNLVSYHQNCVMFLKMLRNNINKIKKHVRPASASHSDRSGQFDQIAKPVRSASAHFKRSNQLDQIAKPDRFADFHSILFRRYAEICADFDHFTNEYFGLKNNDQKNVNDRMMKVFYQLKNIGRQMYLLLSAISNPILPDFLKQTIISSEQ